MARKKGRSIKVNRARNALGALARAGVDKEIARAIPTTKVGEEPAIEFQADATQVNTYFTVIGESRLLFSAERYIVVTLNLETAGPVAVGTQHTITPVLSGKGVLLETDVDRKFVLSKGDRLYIAAESINRVKFIVEPVPYLRHIYGAVINNTKSIAAAVISRIPGATTAPTSSSGKRPSDLPCPPGERRHLKKLPGRGRR